MDRVFLSPPDVGELERAALLAAFDGGWIAPVGPDLDAFETEIALACGTRTAVGLSSGTAALHLALQTAGVGADDTVLVSTFTFAATANAVMYTGAQPVFIDSEETSWNMSPELLEIELRRRVKVGDRPKAVVAVDLYGQCADYGAIEPLCAEYGVTLIEDAAEALGATCNGRRAGSFGHAGVVSFNGNKIITTSGGGMLATDDDALATRVRYLSTQARQPVAHYEHTELGYNYRLSNLLAAMGRAQLSRLPGFIERRRTLNQRYRDAFADLPEIGFMPIAPWGEWNGWLTCVTFTDPELPSAVMAALGERDIESRPLWKPMHRQPVFAGCDVRLNGVSDRLFDSGLCLPSGSVLTDAQFATVVELVRATVLGRRPISGSHDGVHPFDGALQAGA